jgi:RNA polymerase sigma factor (sigma-70 family)
MARARGAGLEELLTHSDWLGRLAHRLAGPAEADDAVQETWLAAQRSPPDPERPPRPWLAGVLRNFLRARWQSDRRRQRRELAQAELAPDREAAVDALYERVEMQRAVAELVMSLEEPIRIVLLLRYFEGHDSTRIGEILGLPAGTVRWRLKRALDRLRAQMDARFGDRRTWALVLAPAPALPAAPAPPAPPPTGPALPTAPALGASSAPGTPGAPSPGASGSALARVRAPSAPAVGLMAAIAASVALVGGAALGVSVGAWTSATGRAGSAAADAPGSSAAPTRRAASWRRFARLTPATAGDQPLRPSLLRSAAAPSAQGPGLAGLLSGWVGLRGEGEDDAIVLANPAEPPRDDRGTAGPVAPSPPARAKTAGGGFFHFEALAPGRYVLTATGHDEGTARSAEVAVADGGSVQDLVIDLQSAGAGLHGRVVDAGAGGISRARVRATLAEAPPRAPLAFEAETGCLGRYRLPLAPGLYGFEIEADGYAPTRFSLQVPSALARSFRLFPAIDVPGHGERPTTTLDPVISD